MSITTATITESSFSNPRHHANLDQNDGNMHHPKGFRSAANGDRSWRSEQAENKYEQFGHLPPALDYVDVTIAPPTTVAEDVYLLDDSGAIYTVSAINFQSGTTVRYALSGSPDLSSLSTSNNVLFCSAATNSEHNGRFVLTTVNDGSDYFEISNPLITDATLDETTGASVEAPNSGWDGGSNGDWVKYDGTDWFRIVPLEGTTSYDKTLQQRRTFNGTKWLGQESVLAIAFGDETTDHKTGTATATFHMPHKVELLSVVLGLTTAATGAVKATGTVTCVSALAADTVTVNGLLYTAVSGTKSDNTEFSIDTGDTETATDLADSITQDTRTGTDVAAIDQTATNASGVVNIVASVFGSAANSIGLSSSNGSRLAVSAANLAGGVDEFTVDLNDDGVSVFSTVLTIDSSEKISTTAATPAVISNPTIAADSLMTVDIDSIGATVAGTGGKIYLKYNRI